MMKDIIEAVTRAEAEAAEIKANADKLADDILREAELEAAGIKKEAEETAKTIKADGLSEAAKEAKEASAAARMRTQLEAEQVRAAALERKQQAVDAVLNILV